MLKTVIIIFLLIKTCSTTRVWTWDDYPSGAGGCRVSKTKYHLCDPDQTSDPDGMFKDESREILVEVLEGFKKKTKRPDSIVPCMRDGLRLVVAIAKNKINDNSSSGQTNLCKSWKSSDKTICDSDLHGIEINTNGFSHCYSASRWLMPLHKKIYESLMPDGQGHLFDLPEYIKKLSDLYNSRFSIFDNHVSNETNIKLQQSLQDTKTTLTEMEQQNKTLSEFTADMEDNKKTLSDMHLSLQDTKKTLSEMRDQQNKTLSEFTENMEENKKTLTEMRQSLDQQNKTLVETNKKLSELKQLLSQPQMLVEKNTTKPLEYIGLFSNNL
ncbi:unnamed protein product [Meloidogyne enterolobii]|uniref:Uncharacterized protein n=1 Tax=Meloidogyne enterolobii TaxID=390850 RepID=A0ACB1AV67_MELEN